MMKLSIVIVSWNTCDLLRRCLETVFAYAPPVSFDVWVVDNHSQDETVAMVQTAFPQVRLIVNQNNSGFAGANNQAIRASSGEYVLLLNPDTEVRPEAVAALVDFLDERPDAGGAGSMLLNPDGSLQPSCYPMLTGFRELWRLLHLDRVRRFGIYDMHSWDKVSPRRVEVIQGASLIVRRSILDRIGLLDDSYFMYTEEVDLCYRIQQAGWSLYWLPQSQVVHYGGQSTRQVAAEMFLHLYGSKVKFFRKHYGRFTTAFYKLTLALASLLRLALSPFLWLQPAGNRQAQLALARNYYQLLRLLPRM
jgi:N-acetylglucosaminyl-diphospho-decaprenol L-rhamnosyltransferase